MNVMTLDHALCSIGIVHGYLSASNMVRIGEVDGSINIMSVIQ